MTLLYSAGNETSVVLSWPDFTHTGYDLIDTQYCEEEEAHGIKLGNLDPVASKCKQNTDTMTSDALI